MKKLSCIIVISLLLVGCGSSTSEYATSVTDGDKIVISGDNSLSVSLDDIYEYLLDGSSNGSQMTYGSSQVLEIAMDMIATIEITDEATINAKRDELFEKYTQYMTDGIDEYIAQLGYSDQNAYIQGIIVPAAKQELLKAKFIDEQFKQLVKDYQVKYLKTIIVDSESTAQTIIDGATDATKFDALFSQYNGTDVGMVTNENTSVDANIIAKLDSFTKDGVYKKAIKTTNGLYTVVYVYNSDISALKEEIKTSLTNSSSMNDKYESFYLKKYKFDVYEQKIKDELEKTEIDYFG